MITLTASAAAAIRKLHAEREAGDLLMRIKVEAGGCSGLEYAMSFDARKESDILIESEGLQVLVDPKSMERIKGSVVDFDDGLNGKGFEIRNPNAQSTCGCGRSFN